MVPVTRYHIPSVALLGVGILIIVTGFQTYPHAGQPAYYHSVEPVSQSEAANVLNFTNLSEHGQRAFLAALQSPDGDTTVYGTANKPPEFSYSDHAGLGAGLYFVHYQGGYYELTTAGEGLTMVNSPRLVMLGVYALAGLTFIGIAGVSLRNERPRLPLTLLVGLVCWYLVGVQYAGDLPFAPAIGFVVGPAVGTWLLLAQTPYWTPQ